MDWGRNEDVPQRMHLKHGSDTSGVPRIIHVESLRY